MPIHCLYTNVSKSNMLELFDFLCASLYTLASEYVEFICYKTVFILDTYKHEFVYMYVDTFMHINAYILIYAVICMYLYINVYA